MPKVLLVDDNEDERRLYYELLYYNSFDVVVAKSGFEAIELAKSEKPDVILVDYMMPVMNGLGVAEALQKLPETQSIPIVCMTAYDLAADRAKAVGCVEVWRKPVPPGRLVLGLERIVKTHEEPPISS